VTGHWEVLLYAGYIILLYRNLQSSAATAVVVGLRPKEVVVLLNVILYATLTVILYSVNSFNPENMVDLQIQRKLILSICKSSKKLVLILR